MDILIPYLHFIGIMVLMGSLVSEHLLLKPGINKTQIKSLAGIDLVYGISAIIVLTTGLLRWFVNGKGSEFYLSNPIFHIKVTLFVVLAVLSIFPTIRFMKWRKQIKQGNEPEVDEKTVKRLLMFIRIELLILAVMPFLAVLVARGVGH